MKIGLYFGSFNPIHVGHLIIANHLTNNTDLKQVWMVISPHNPLKPSASLLNEYDRLHLLRTAVEGANSIKVSTVEFKLPKPSYTVDTLAYLTEKFPHHEFAVVMGSDSFCNLTKWKNFEVIIKNHPLYIYNRPGFKVDNIMEANITIVDAPLLEISSTHIRKLIKEGKSIRYLVTDVIKEEIEKNNFYK